MHYRGHSRRLVLSYALPVLWVVAALSVIGCSCSTAAAATTSRPPPTPPVLAPSLSQRVHARSHHDEDDTSDGEQDALATIDLGEFTTDSVDCQFDEIQLASDGAIERRSLEMGERVRPNTTMSGRVERDDYHFYHLCIMRHEHEHRIDIRLACTGGGDGDEGDGDGDASLYLSSREKYPRIGHSSWIAQQRGDEFVKLFTYLDGFPRKTDLRNRSISLHIGIHGVAPRTRYNLSVAVLDLPMTEDIRAREKYYTERHHSEERQRRRTEQALLATARHLRHH